eukprot:Pompholyxophrys_punicea_v1_NODE_118_length_3370_cov_2.781900.p3 type:complete len:183 gc:universal NODE_118_length_3370_cov_2.781900:2416-1868(-)
MSQFIKQHARCSCESLARIVNRNDFNDELGIKAAKHGGLKHSSGKDLLHLGIAQSVDAALVSKKVEHKRNAHIRSSQHGQEQLHVLWINTIVQIGHIRKIQKIVFTFDNSGTFNQDGWVGTRWRTTATEPTFLGKQGSKKTRFVLFLLFFRNCYKFHSIKTRDNCTPTIFVLFVLLRNPSPS